MSFFLYILFIINNVKYNYFSYCQINSKFSDNDTCIKEKYTLHKYISVFIFYTIFFIYNLYFPLITKISLPMDRHATLCSCNAPCGTYRRAGGMCRIGARQQLARRKRVILKNCANRLEKYDKFQKMAGGPGSAIFATCQIID